MGEVIRKNDAVSDILADARTTLARAKARPGSAFEEAAEAHLAPVLGLISAVEAELADARAAAEPLLAALEAADEAADATIGREADAVWNAVGRPRADPALSVIFPGGNAHYTDGDVAEQPDRMDLLARLLRSNLHPRLAPEIARASADAIEAEASRLRSAVEAAAKPRALVKLLETTHQALARSAAMELSKVKRLLKTKGLSEAEIHEVIPDRPRAKPKAPVPAA